MRWMSVTGRVRSHQESLVPVATEFRVDGDIPAAIVPEEVFRAIGAQPTGERTFPLGDGRKVVRKVARAYFEIEGGAGYAELAMGGGDDLPRLAKATLQACGLDPERFKLP